jgi:predicted transposase YbfD/YdcC
LELLAVEGGVVTIDALHCQTATTQTIVERGADSVPALNPLRQDTTTKAGWDEASLLRLLSEKVPSPWLAVSPASER